MLQCGSYKTGRACFIIGDKDKNGGMSCNMLNTAPGSRASVKADRAVAKSQTPVLWPVSSFQWARSVLLPWFLSSPSQQSACYMTLCSGAGFTGMPEAKAKVGCLSYSLLIRLRLLCHALGFSAFHLAFYSFQVWSPSMAAASSNPLRELHGTWVQLP